MTALNAPLVNRILKPVMGLFMGLFMGVLISSALLTACQTTPHITPSPVGADGVTIAGPQL